MVDEFQTPVHLSGQTCVLRLALHTWRAYSVMRRARQGMRVIFSLLVMGWSLGAVIIRLLQRQAAQARQAARRQELARLSEVWGGDPGPVIRNPLAGIKGCGQLLQEWLSNDRVDTPNLSEYNPVEIFWRWIQPKVYGFSALGGLDELVSSFRKYVWSYNEKMLVNPTIIHCLCQSKILKNLL